MSSKEYLDALVQFRIAEQARADAANDLANATDREDAALLLLQAVCPHERTTRSEGFPYTITRCVLCGKELSREDVA